MKYYVLVAFFFLMSCAEAHLKEFPHSPPDSEQENRRPEQPEAPSSDYSEDTDVVEDANYVLLADTNQEVHLDVHDSSSTQDTSDGASEASDDTTIDEQDTDVYDIADSEVSDVETLDTEDSSEDTSDVSDISDAVENDVADTTVYADITFDATIIDTYTVLDTSDSCTQNACGGCNELDVPVGEPCGRCLSGIYTCADTDNIICEGDAGEDALNACGGCAELDHAPGDQCYECGEVWQCTGLNALVCHPLPTGCAGLSCDDDYSCNAEHRCIDGMCVPRGMQQIPAGTFMMGSPDTEYGREPDERLHEVTITRDYFMDEIEVTQEMFMSILGTNPSYFRTCLQCPVENVTWFDTLAYANARSRQEHLEECYNLSECTGIEGMTFDCPSVEFVGLQCNGYRLPTEAEWEYAARAGTTTTFYCGNDPDCLPAYTWYEETIFGEPGEPRQSYLLDPNAWDLYSMGGNVFEWVWDGNKVHPTVPQIDPLGSNSFDRRIAKGGSANNVWWWVAPARRIRPPPDGRSYDVGFRLARTVPQYYPEGWPYHDP